MSEVKRYRLCTDGTLADGNEHHPGEYILYADHAAQVAALEAELFELKSKDVNRQTAIRAAHETIDSFKAELAKVKEVAFMSQNAAIDLAKRLTESEARGEVLMGLLAQIETTLAGIDCEDGSQIDFAWQTAKKALATPPTATPLADLRAKANTLTMWTKRLLGVLDSIDGARDDQMLKDDPLARTLLMQGLREDLETCHTKTTAALAAYREVKL
jgi:hypothetical protein